MSRWWLQMATLGVALETTGCVLAPPPPLPGPGPGAAYNTPTCQQFTQPIVVNGQTVTGYGLQCLEADGAWHVVSAPNPNPPQAQVMAAPVAGVYPDAYGAYYPYAAYGYPLVVGPSIDIGYGRYGGWGGGDQWGGGGRWRGGWRR